MAQLRYLDDAGHIRTAQIGAGRFVIGRVGGCNITFVDDMVSREHSEIKPTKDNRYSIRDLGSRNKTLVNGETVAETVLAGGDVIRIGDRVLEFLDDAGPAPGKDLEFLTPDRSEPAGCAWIKTKTPLTLSLDQLGRLSGVFNAGGVMIRPEDVVEAALSHLLIELQAERGFVALRGESKRDLRPICQRGLNRAPGAGLMPVSQTFTHTAMLQQVAGRYPETGAQIDAKSGYAATALVAPLVFRSEVLGLIYLDRPTAKRSFTDAQLQQLMAASALLAANMAGATRRLGETAGREGHVYMSHVRRMHSRLTPSIEPPSGFEFASQLVPGSGRCGDICDLVGVEEAGACALIVDAAGHGAAGVAQAAAVRTAIRTALAVPGAVADLGGIFNALNQALLSVPGRQFIACCCAHVDLSAGRLTYVNAAAPMPLLIPAATRLQVLDHPSLILGTDAAYNYEATTVDLPSDFRLVLHTDGLIDAANAGGEVFGTERLNNVLLDSKAFTSPAKMVQQITAAFQQYLAGQPHDDDALVMVLGR
ncbi:MAG: SpoIIE family protein phosphatase [Phycisphaerae bacterium]